MKSKPPARASSERGAATRGAILAAAEAILVTEGGHALTLRGVAQQTGIALGNLQYHYPSLGALLEALLHRLLELGATRVRAAADGRRGQEVATVVDALLADHDDARMVRLFVELWALAAAAPPLRRSLGAFYDRFAGALSDELIYARPTGGDGAAPPPPPTAAPTGERADIHPRAYTAVALLEGLALFRSGVCGRRRTDVDRVARELLIQLLGRDGSPESATASRPVPRRGRRRPRGGARRVSRSRRGGPWTRGAPRRW